MQSGSVLCGSNSMLQLVRFSSYFVPFTSRTKEAKRSLVSISLSSVPCADATLDTGLTTSRLEGGWFDVLRISS